MWMKCKNAKVALISACVLSGVMSGNAFAGASGSIVFDPSNYIQNSLTATQTLKQLESQIEQYAMQKYGIDVNLRNLPGSAINNLIAKYPPKNRYELNYLNDLRDLGRQMGVSRMSVQQQFQAMSASGLSPSQYVNQETQLANSNQAHAAAGFEQAKTALKQTNSMAKTVQKQGKKIGKVKGTSQEMNLLNTQLHTVIQQNQTLLKLVASNSISKNNQNSESAAAKKRSVKEQSGIDKFIQNRPSIQKQAQQAGKNLGNIKIPALQHKGMIQ